VNSDERGLEVGLFRYASIRDAADPSLSKAKRGALVRALASREHVGPDGRPQRAVLQPVRWQLLVRI